MHSIRGQSRAIALVKDPTITPRSKHIAILYHLFREYVRRKEIDVAHAVTDYQLANMLTKGLVQVKFEKLFFFAENGTQRAEHANSDK